MRLASWFRMPLEIVRASSARLRHCLALSSRSDIRQTRHDVQGGGPPTLAGLGVRLVSSGCLFQASQGSARRSPVDLRVMVAVDLLVEGLGVERAGGVGDAGDD